MDMGIYIWGTGCGAAELLDQGLSIDKVEAFVDSYPSDRTFMGKPVLLPDELPLQACELLLVTTRQSKAVEQRCMELGIAQEKILYLKNGQVILDRNAQCTAAEKLLGQELLKKLLPPIRLLRQPPGLIHNLQEKELENDYVRLATLELICQSLKDIPGAAAELGVYKGAFARCINLLMPERTLYLFDSFQGFEEEEGRREQAADHCQEVFLEAHKNTNAEQVLARMPCSEKIVLKQGYFPESLKGLEDGFCLVSLDVDFEETTLEGLRYFWPRLAAGGYLLLHDYHSPHLTGVKKAVERFERETGTRLPGIPLCDIGGTLAVRKV